MLERTVTFFWLSLFFAAVSNAAITNDNHDATFADLVIDSVSHEFTGDEVIVTENSTLTLTGAGRLNDVSASGSARFVMTGGALDGDDEPVIQLGDTATALISGGSIDAEEGNLVTAAGQSHVDVAGGIWTTNATPGFSYGFLAMENAVIDIGGGSFTNPPDLDLFVAIDSGIINIYGQSLSINNGVLTGVLSNGDEINAKAMTMDSGQIILHNVPEPATGMALFLALAALAALKGRAY